MSEQDATQSAADEREAGIAGFITHLVELRNRLLKSVLVVLVLFLALFPFRNDLFSMLSDPLSKHMPTGTTMIAVQVASPFFIPLKLTALTAVFIAIPFLLYQLWAFIAPGLYKHERKMVVPLVFSSTVLFYLGTAFAYFVVFPIVFGFLSTAGPSDVNFAPDISEYLSFVTTLFFAFGLVFEVPVATVLLIIAGVVTPAQLAEKRRYAILVAFIIGAIFTPPDVLSQFMMAVPVWLLYELGIIVGRFVYKQKEEQAADHEGEESEESDLAAGDDVDAATSGNVDEDIEARHRRYETEADEEEFDFDKAFDEAVTDQDELHKPDDETDKNKRKDSGEDGADTNSDDDATPGDKHGDDEEPKPKPDDSPKT
jgi:sec-independent protein translocase protein TatC